MVTVGGGGGGGGGVVVTGHGVHCIRTQIAVVRRVRQQI